MKKILLIGGGGHCKSVIDSINSMNCFKIYGIIDQKSKIGEKINGIEIIDSDENLLKYRNCVEYAFICIGSIGNPFLRVKLYNHILQLGFNVPIIIDKTAIIGENVIIKKGTFIGKGVVINNGTYIGENCIINTASTIEHDCIIKDNVHIAPKATLCGGVKVGKKSHIGAGSIIIQYLNVGENVLIGAGSVVVKNISDNVKAYGNPCKEV